MDMQTDAEVIRSMIQHEDTLVIERTNWMLTLEGLLFTALAFAWEKNHLLVIVLSVLGLVSSVTLGVYMRYATRAITKLQQWWGKRMEDQNYNGPPIIGLADEDFSALEMKILPQKVMPVLFALAWILVACLRAMT